MSIAGRKIYIDTVLLTIWWLCLVALFIAPFMSGGGAGSEFLVIGLAFSVGPVAVISLLSGLIFRHRRLGKNNNSGNVMRGATGLGHYILMFFSLLALGWLIAFFIFRTLV